MGYVIACCSGYCLTLLTFITYLLYLIILLQENYGKCMPQNTTYSEVAYFKFAVQLRKQQDFFYTSIKEYFNTTLVSNATVITKQNLQSAVSFKAPTSGSMIQPLIKCEITGTVTLFHSIVTCVNQDFEFVQCPETFKNASPDQCGSSADSIIIVPPLSNLHTQ